MEVKTIYVANDGKEFVNEFECYDYERSLESPVIMFTYEGKKTDRITNANVVYVKGNACRPQLLKFYNKVRDIVGSDALKYSFLLQPMISNTFFFWTPNGFQRIDLNAAAIVTSAFTAICNQNAVNFDGLEDIAANVEATIDEEDLPFDGTILNSFIPIDKNDEEDFELDFDDDDEEDSEPKFELKFHTFDEDEDEELYDEDEDYEAEPEDPDYSDYDDDQESEDEFWARVASMNHGN